MKNLNSNNESTKMHNEYLTYLKNENNYTDEEKDKLLSYFTKAFSQRVFKLLEEIKKN